MPSSPAELMSAYEKATAAHDLEATLALVSEDAVYLFSDRSSHVGKAAIREVLARNFATIEGESYEIRSLRWLVRGADAAACVYEFRWSGRIRGEPASGGGRGTSVARREGETWRIAHEHLSAGGLGTC